MTREEMGRLQKKLLERGAVDLGALVDAFDLERSMETHEGGNEIRKLATAHIKRGGGMGALELYNKSLIYDAPVNFDCFMRAIERNRPMAEQFWLPRRSKLLPVCQALQDMEDGKLDELFLSCPPRVGKTTMMVMFLLWVMGRNSERSNLYCSFTNKPVDTFYAGLLEILQDPATYAYNDVFPIAKVAGTNANDATVDLDRKKRYHSFTGRPIRGSLNGSCDCNGYLVADDLCEGIEEALSPDRMHSLWTHVDNNLIPRAKEGAKRLWIGTRWSLIDPQGLRLDILQNEPKYANVRWKCINTPALNEKDESNFDYGYGVGFSTEFYQMRRASFERNNDVASWSAQYQGMPIEREGAVFNPDDLRFYNGVLPDADPDRIFMAVDPAWGGGDFVAAPIVYQYGDDLYVVDVIYDNGEKNITQPLIVKAIKDYHVGAVKVEGTKMTASYGEDIDKQLRASGIRVNMQINTKHFTGNGKRQRIFDKAPEIRERMVFLQDGNRSKAYQLFMNNLYAFTVSGKQAKHDDAPDSCAMVCDMAFHSYSRAEVITRPF